MRVGIEQTSLTKLIMILHNSMYFNALSALGSLVSYCPNPSNASKKYE